MYILSPDNNFQKAINETVKVLKNGGLVIAPSDTVYGLLVDATNAEAVKKLIAFKNRPIGKSISAFVADFSMLQDNLVVNEHQSKVLNTLLPGPFTVVLPSKHKVSKLIESEKGTLGIRLIEYPFIKELSKAFGKPITATSANLSGKAPYHSAESLLKQLPESKIDLVDLVIDAGKLPRNKPSTVIDLTQSTVKILRQGDIVWKNQETYASETESQTKKLAQYILEKADISKITQKPLVIILKGDLGAGKTVFVKGIGEMLRIKKIISPTFTIYYEYEVEKNDHIKNLYHFDLYNIEDPEEFKYLGINEYLKAENILVFEWGEKAGDLYESFKEKADIVFVEIIYSSPEEREIKVKFQLNEK